MLGRQLLLTTVLARVSGGLASQAVDLALHELPVQPVLVHKTVGRAVLNCLA